jgi:hypothetical protein
MRLAALLAVFALAAPLSAPACADSPLRLNEILAGPATDWDGSGTFSSRDDEWVEVVNTSTSPLDLNGFYLTDGDSIPRYAFTGSLAAGARLVVYGKNSWDWERANGYPAFGLSLGNSGDQVLLWQISGPDSAVVEAYTYRSHEAAADRAIGRSPDSSGGWALFDSLNPYTGSLTPSGTGCAPSPGAPNSCGTTPTKAVTWGRVKSIFR